MTKTNHFADHPFAPLNPAGLLPPGLSATHLASAYRSHRKDLRPKKVLKLLGAPNHASATSSDLRREMDDPQSRQGENRHGEITDVPPLFIVLYDWLKQQQWATTAYEEVVQPSETVADNRVFLDAEHFRDAVNTGLLNHAGDDHHATVPSSSSSEALALFALAYALLQPSQAAAIVTSLIRLGPGFARFFGTDDASLREVAAAHQRQLYDDLQALRRDIQDRGRALVTAGTRMQECSELPGETVLTPLSDLHSRRDYLRSGIYQLLEARRLTGTVDLPEDSQPDVLLSVLDALDRHYERNAKVAAALDKACRLSYRDASDNPVLQSCRSEVAELRQLAQSGAADARLAAIADGTHALVHLIRLVDDLDVLADEEFEHLRQQVADAYGSTLARAVSRGLINISDSNEPPSPVRPKGLRPTEPDSAEPPRDHGDSEPGDPDDVAPAKPPAATSTPQRNLVQQSSTEPEGSAASGKQSGPRASSTEAPATERGGQSSAPRPRSAIGTDHGKRAGFSPPDDPTPLFVSMWQLLAAGRRSLAFQLARTLEALYPSVVSHLPSDVVRLAMLSPLVQSSTGPLTDAVQYSLRRVAENLHETRSLPDVARGALDVVVVCSSLRPALLAPASDAVSLLASITVPELRALQQAVLHHAELRLEITPSVLKGMREQAEWENLLSAHREAVGRWLPQNRNASIIYAPTTKIWRNWLEPSQPLGMALESVQRDDRSAAPRVRRTAEEWGATSYVKDQVSRTDRALRGRLADLRSIDARALTSIATHALQAVELLVGWLALLDSGPVASGPRLKQGEKCRSAILEALRRVGNDPNAFINESDDSTYGPTARAVATGVLRNLEGLFDPAVAEAVPPPSADVLCGIDLLRLADIALDADWEPIEGRTPTVLQALITAAGNPEMAWPAALEMKTQERDHRATQRILDHLDTTVAVPERELEELRGRRDREYRRCVRWFVGQVEEARAKIVRAASYDVLPEPTFLDLKGRIDSIQPEQILVFGQAHGRLTEIQDQLEEYNATRVGQVRERRKVDLPNARGAIARRIEESLSQGNVAAANEYIDLAIEGRTIDLEPDDDAFGRFFPGFLTEINAFWGDDKPNTVGALIGDVRGNGRVGPLDMRSRSKAHAAEAARTLRAWYEGKARKGPDASRHLIRVFEGLGFEEVRVTGEPITPSEQRWSGELRVRPIADRDVCSVPRFGSSAQGRYRILCCWDRPSEDEFLRAGDAEITRPPVLVVYFGRMTEARRRDLAYISRARKRPLLVLDEAVVWFLCGESGSRLRKMFRVLLPFSTEDPYITTASLLPPEMFFGRAHERRSIVDPFGTNLVYGGRQLGKTALLRDVERHFHRPDQGVIVRWLDLFVEHIGVTRPIEDIWAVIAAALQREKVVTPTSTVSKTIVRQIRTWVEADDARRIVLLLDEADEFLKGDTEQQFKQLVQLKGLMDVTSRRFKVVFAGLHNVQRSSRAPNTQLGHLGQPICVGPLLKHDAAQAVALIQRPLTDLGYRFESSDLPMRILSHTNYYPSLIQIYCKHLLAYLTDETRPLFDVKDSPPYIIRNEHLDAVQDEELREKILGKFRLTLDLDPRYRVVALCIALETLQEEALESRPRGVDPAWVRDQALEWWPRGFADDTSLEGFRTILEEMVGLGVVRRVDAHGYTLRSPNLAHLLGTQKEIEDELLDAMERQPPAPYEALHFRRGIADDPTVRSPLTAQQEAEVVAASSDVVVVCGAPLAEVGEVGPFLRLASPDCECEVLEVGTEVVDVLECVEKMHRGDVRLGLIVVAAGCRWSNDWVTKIRPHLRRRKSSKRFVRVVFVADPQRVWAWTGASSPRRELLREGVREVSLRQWTEPSLRRWLDDLGIAPGDGDGRDRIGLVTGGWASPLRIFAERCQQESHRWQVHLEGLERELLGDTGWRKRMALRTEALPLFRIMKELAEPVRQEDLLGLLEGATPEDVERIVGWAELLSYVKKSARNAWVLDSLVARLLAVQ